MIVSSDARPYSFALAFGGMALCVWWIGAYYRGFEHDAVFYAAEALFRGGLANLQADPFFSYGSQGDFSIFVAPYSELLHHGDPQRVALWLTILGRWIWLASLIALVFELTSSNQCRVMAVGILLILPTYYEPFRVFSYGEAFTTPRLFAESAALFAFTALVRQRLGKGFLLSALSLAVHPLMAIPVAGVAMLMTPHWTRLSRPQALRLRLALLTAGMTIIAALAALQVGPLDRLFLTYDDAWWDIIKERNFVTVVQAWSSGDLMREGAWLLLLLLGTRRLPDASGAHRLGTAVFITATFCVAAWVTGSLCRNVLIVQLQPWRAMWLVHVLAPVLWVVAAGRVVNWTPGVQALYLLIVAAALSGNGSALILVLLAALIHYKSDIVSRHLSERSQRSLAAALILIVAGTRLAGLRDLMLAADVLTDATFPWLRALAWEPVVWLLAFGCGFLACRRWPPRTWVSLSMVVAGPLTALLGFGVWLTEAHQRMPLIPKWIDQVQESVPPGSTIYWQRPVEQTWLDLRRAHYASDAQGASALFSRPGALELRRRLERLRELGLAGGRGTWPSGPGSAKLDQRRSIALCQDASLDYVIANDLSPLATTQVQASGSETLSIFDCKRHRESAAAVTTHEQS